MAKKPPPRRLSEAPEEDIFLNADAKIDKVVAALRPLIRARYREIAASSRWRERAAAAFLMKLPGMVATAADWEIEARVTASRRSPLDVPASWVQKAKGKKMPGVSEAELISEAAEAGVDQALEALPKKIARQIDRDDAVRRARKRLRKAAFRRSLDELEAARSGLERLSSRATGPAMASILDSDGLANSFGINESQARAIAKQAQAMLDRGDKPAVIRRWTRDKIEQAIDSRSEMIANAIGNEAINAGNAAVLEIAEEMGLLERDFVREWVTREDSKVCPRCQRFHGAQAAPGEDFVSAPDEDGEVETAAETGIHPRCRCRERYVSAAGSAAA